MHLGVSNTVLVLSRLAMAILDSIVYVQETVATALVS